MPNLRKAARGAPCCLNLPGCAPGPENETVVLAHRRGGGMALKQPDTEAVLACYNCHTLLDGPASKLPGPYDLIFDAAKERTHRYWRRKGYEI